MVTPRHWHAAYGLQWVCPLDHCDRPYNLADEAPSQPATQTFSPSITMPDGSTQTPTNLEWVTAFALKGQRWAIDMLKRREDYEHIKQKQQLTEAAHKAAEFIADYTTSPNRTEVFLKAARPFFHKDENEAVFKAHSQEFTYTEAKNEVRGWRHADGRILVTGVKIQYDVR